jgi:tetratricopeptide (TPR) repeat protein
VRILREKGDDTNVRIATVAHELETIRQSMASLQNACHPGDLGAQLADAGRRPGPARSRTPPAPPPRIRISSAPANRPRRCTSRRGATTCRGNYDLAVKGFNAYLRSFPPSPNAYRAQFNIGEALKFAKRPREAIQAYTAVITNYKGSPWEDQAYYARGLAYEELSMKDQARADLSVPHQEFPDSTFTPLSRSALERIK